LRACWLTQRSCRFPATPPKWTRRLANSMKKSTYKRRSQTVSTVRKSQATIADACARRNSDQLSSAADIAGQAYTIDDQTAINVVNGTAEVVSEGQWKLFTPSLQTTESV
jgi:hypothetical protein